ncbi:hypothetical protein F5H01DRAFT_26551 [Linnemannia elongata]|nr:hypothetical protein F5H01DRAFT_26551 [Linnemannia elongata]
MLPFLLLSVLPFRSFFLPSFLPPFLPSYIFPSLHTPSSSSLSPIHPSSPLVCLFSFTFSFTSLLLQTDSPSLFHFLFLVSSLPPLHLFSTHTNCTTCRLMSSSILSTHSGHHRIFIGPVVQGRINNNNNNTTNVTVTSTTSSHSHHKNHNHTQPKHTQAQAPKPWWEQGSSFLRSHLSLHNVSTSATTTTPPLTNSNRTTPATTPSPQQHPALSTSQRQTNIPQFSYTFSDDDEHSSCSSSEDGDEEINAYDSEDERRDYTQDHDVNDDDDEDGNNNQDDDSEINNEPVNGNNHPFHTSSSSESFSAPVAAGHSNSSSSSSGYNQHQQQHGQQSSEESGQLLNVDSNGNPTKNKDKGKARDADAQAQQAQDDEYMSRTKSVKRWRTGGKKRTKSMRDEGEPNRFKKMLGSRRDRQQKDEPDLGWESDGSR